MRPAVDALAALLASATTGGTVAGELPARFESDLVYLEVPHPGGGLRLYTDTGGGLLLRQTAVQRLGLPTSPAPAELAAEVGPQATITPWPQWLTSAGLPAPSHGDASLLVMPSQAGGELPGMGHDDGLLGQAWFADRVWTWDYPGGRFRLEASDWRAPRDAVAVALQFKTDPGGKRQTSFPRIEVNIDGHTVPLLLDTGAMTVLTQTALTALDDGRPAQRATSMIADSLFQAWRRDHPQWRVIEQAQAGTGSAMIEVPWIEVAGWRVGPVWFTHRPDANFHQFMSGMMADRVEGALGGNALGHFTMTIDYPRSQAWFRCTAACMQVEARR